nr:immunoglobulin light chain junction region [Macaca mulatta]MOV95071.1 immunoglobulin light chain junction region [Macaca mulatta]MOV95076.1 immunoglobulin light chain junction region [Macaca mulatta]MOV95186.1 immunoglobulin light chain junction region [Macaca mulatta]MOV96181.1 immunoglobulin light chain junction region [Macaca mulatta]
DYFYEAWDDSLSGRIF